MADKLAERIAELIKPLRVKPGSKVNLAKDFDPGPAAVRPPGASRSPAACGQPVPGGAVGA
jgi:hypothetical protein